MKVICANCKKEFDLLPSEYRLRMKRNRTGKMYCSVQCSADANVRVKR